MIAYSLGKLSKGICSLRTVIFNNIRIDSYLSTRKMSSAAATGSSGRTVIFLFRNDLRFHDNEALQWAHR